MLAAFAKNDKDFEKMFDYCEELKNGEGFSEGEKAIFNDLISSIATG